MLGLFLLVRKSKRSYSRSWALPGSDTPGVTEEARLEQTDVGLVPKTEGWFVLNAREARWYHAPGRSAFCDFEGDTDWQQLGMNIAVLEPGQPMAMYHWEADQEDFLVVSGEAVLVVEGEERPLVQWDLAHCPPGTKHTIVGTGDAPCVIVALGARDHQDGPDWGGYTPDEAAAKHGAGVEQATNEPREAYAHLTRRQPVRYDGFLD
jgi:uncharacterized cupin superfamily protein